MAFAHVVRGLLTWLMMLGVFAGLSVRAVDFGHSHEHHHASEHGASGHGHDDPAEPIDHDGECPKSCPHGEHHHHACCLSQPWAVDGGAVCFLSDPDSLRLGLQLLRLVPPEGPVFDLDKPPLI